MDLCDRFPCADRDALRQVLAAKADWVGQAKRGFLRYREPWQSARHLRASSCDFSGDVVRIGSADDLAPCEQEQVREVLRAFMPWRKGPCSVFGIDIDAEWRSERKWNRILPGLPGLAGRVVADIGSNNG